MKIKPQHIHFFMGVSCIASLVLAMYYFQTVIGLLACPLCVIQRIAYILIAVTALIAAAHRPVGAVKWLYTGLLALWSLAGGAVAGWQLWLIQNPHLAGCRISPEEKFLNTLPLQKWWPDMFSANGDCTSVTWSLFGLSIPDLSFIFFVVLFLLTVFAAVIWKNTRVNR